MNKIKTLTINGEKYVPLKYLTKTIGKERIHIDQNDELSLSLNGFHENTSQKQIEKDTLPNLSQPDIESYWERAATENKRELFMNTIRPELKEALGYNFSEILLEQKAKLLCARWYFYAEKGEKYTGPYLIE